MKVYFVRHGEADYDLEVKPGEFPGVPLTKRGIGHAHILSQTLKDIDFDGVYCSDMLRAKQTIGPMLKYLKQKPVFDGRLREICDLLVGDCDYCDFEESVNNQKARMGSFIKFIKKKNYENMLVVCHFGVIKYMASALGNKINSPECGSYYCIEYRG